VGFLWIIGGHLREISHGESRPAADAMNRRSRPLILARFSMSDRKCQRTHTSEFFFEQVWMAPKIA
jgi:hypothetical protein